MDIFLGINFFDYLEHMDLGQIIYIVAIVAYFLYRSVNKKKAGEVENPEEPNADPPKKGLTFEDLLREIRESQVPTLPEERPKRIKLPEPVPVSTTTNSAPFPTKKVHEQVPELVEESRYYAGSFEGNNKNPYQELGNRNFADPESIKLKSNEIQASGPNPYAELLKNPKSVREAIVVSEILRPKYF
jgi:hypothetical protein